MTQDPIPADVPRLLAYTSMRVPTCSGRILVGPDVRRLRVYEILPVRQTPGDAGVSLAVAGEGTEFGRA